MILVGDCGGTKADWAWLQTGHNDQVVSTLGFNPVVHQADRLRKEVDKLANDLLPNLQAQQIYYYGAGCWDVRRKRIVEQELKRTYPKADIQVMHDLLGAARAACGHEAGIACILGTGSNSCQYDGSQVTDNITNLGYLLGDEGSGTHLGKSLLRAYFYRELDHKLTQAFEDYAQIDALTVRDRIYEGDAPNTYLAEFTRFMSEHKTHPSIVTMVLECFGEFLDRHVRKYIGHQAMPISFIGSIAFHFRDLLLVALEQRNLQPGNFVQKPIQALADFHRATLQ
ncbi:MAG: hypothetical protein AAGF87_06820 [Bacteroidota bacterium]